MRGNLEVPENWDGFGPTSEVAINSAKVVANDIPWFSSLPSSWVLRFPKPVAVTLFSCSVDMVKELPASGSSEIQGIMDQCCNECRRPHGNSLCSIVAFVWREVQGMQVFCIQRISEDSPTSHHPTYELCCCLFLTRFNFATICTCAGSILMYWDLLRSHMANIYIYICIYSHDWTCYIYIYIYKNIKKRTLCVCIRMLLKNSPIFHVSITSPWLDQTPWSPWRGGLSSAYGGVDGHSQWSLGGVHAGVKHGYHGWWRWIMVTVKLEWLLMVT